MKAKIKKALVIILAVSVFAASCFALLGHLKAKGRPSIILITLDALRPDHLGCYGYGRNTSPHIDRIAKEGAIFTQAIAQSSYTAGSVASLITSTYPNIHGVKDWEYQLSRRIPFTLAEILKRQGYATALISDQISLPLISRLADGFTTFNTLRSYTFGPNAKKKQVVNITDWAINWLKGNRKNKFFLWLYYINPHGPYVAHPPYDKIFLHDKYYNPKKKLPFSDNPYQQFAIGAIPRYLMIGNIREVDYYISQYDGEIAYVDEQIGRLREALKSLGLDKNTVIIINSDHGEGMGEHNQYFSHTVFLYDYLIRVPLIIKFAKDIPAGIKIGTQVRGIDIAPTILDLLGIPKYEFMQGESLLPLLRNPDYNFDPFSYSEFFGIKCVRTNEWKLIYNSENRRYELYNLKNDPLELNDLSSAEKSRFEFFKEKLDDYMHESDPQEIKIRRQLSQDEKERLKSLGYAK